MTQNPFQPIFEDLPEALPVFPLTGAILLPRAQLPLNIFEPRYLSMTLDALGKDRMIGMIQPRQNNESNRDAKDENESDGPTPIYEIGCAGRITSFSETGDGRLFIVLSGVCRFRVGSEIESSKPYRLVQPQWAEFKSDLEPKESVEIDLSNVKSVATNYLKNKSIEFDPDAFENVEADELTNVLAMQLPLDVPDKQALVEATDVTARARLLIALCEMATESYSASPSTRH
ncbi:MAG: LON peptidase substrate-binding domain-containing protein [Gammaproteobacteria bacterium]|nr:LON peptidase substrate-binding domain-containing protein [Gammaproteobacteria bacterium]